MSENKTDPTAKDTLQNSERRKFFGKSAAIGVAAASLPMTATMFATMAKAQAAEVSNSAVVHPGDLDEYYGF